MMKAKFNMYISVLIITVATSTVIISSIAGDLQPSAPPAPTMKTLNEIPPSWSQTLPGASRYTLVLNDDAVLDKETGLVWQQDPAAVLRTWNQAIQRCYDAGTGRRAGWRLPTVSEMGSLFGDWDGSHAISAGHPFSIPDLNNCAGVVCQFWTSTSVENDVTKAYTVRIEIISGTWRAADAENKTDDFRAWCVRGGSGHVGQ